MNKIRLGNKDFYYQVFYKNNKNMYLRIKDNLIVVTCNKRINRTKIEDFIQMNQLKILKTLSKNTQRIPLYNEETMQLFGDVLAINYILNTKKNSFCIQEGVISIRFKSSSFDVKYLEKIYQEVLLEKMKRIVVEEKDSLERYFDTSDITFKTQLMKSRFGSCIASKRIIKLNSILARFSIHYIRTILIHELIHLKEQNHQAGFYRYVDILIPNYRKTVKEINQLTGKYVI